MLKSCYELWQGNDFTYQGPVSLSDKTLSFDNTLVQNIKFPRDIIRDKSATCIDLSGRPSMRSYLSPSVRMRRLSVTLRESSPPAVAVNARG